MVIVASIASCEPADQETSTPAFVPSWIEARQALETSLASWREAPRSSPSATAMGAVQFVDKTRKPDQRLLSFQILGQTDIENARQFTVRLNLEGDDSPQLVKYDVLGRNPVWVFRLDDYEMFAHWEHEMSEPTDQSSAKPKDPVETPPVPR